MTQPKCGELWARLGVVGLVLGFGKPLDLSNQFRWEFVCQFSYFYITKRQKRKDTMVP